MYLSRMVSILYSSFVLVIFCAYAKSQAQDCEERDIRLTDDRFSTPLEGRVQVCLNGVWGTVCDDGWQEENNDVVCRQIGAKLGVDILSSIYRGNIGRVNRQYSSFPIHLSNVRCTGNEANLLDCSSSYVSCSNYEDVTVMCIPTDPTSPLLPNCTGEQFQCLNGFCATENQRCNGQDNCGDNSDETGCNNCVEGDIRLNGTFHRTPLAGRVEVCLGGIWGSICTYTEGRWTDENVMVACRQLGGELGESISSSYNLGDSRNLPDAILDESGPAISMIGVNCVGDEESLLDCSFRQEVDNECYQYRDNVAVLCVPTDPTSPLLPNCTEREFKCLNGYCVDEVYMCDARNNCGDNSDETAPECLILQNKFRQDFKDEQNLPYLNGISIGVSLGIVFAIMLIWLVFFGICMLVPQCPLSNLYSRKAVGPNPATRQGVSGDERGGADEPEIERSNAPLFTN